MRPLLIPAAISLTLPITLAYLGVNKMLGAHIWWDVKTVLIGAPIGVILAYFVGFSPAGRNIRIIAFIILTLAAFGFAKYGQTTFANSYAEDQLAGKFWYFGWIAIAAFVAAAIFTAARRTTR